MHRKGEIPFRIVLTLSLLAVSVLSCGTKDTNALATSTLEPTPSSTSALSSSTEIPIPKNCVTIAYPQQPRNAFRAWLALNQPEDLTFHNDAGPDGDGKEVKVNRQTLPKVVHLGDRFCSP